MSAVFTRRGTQRPVRWSTVFGIILVPLTVAGVLLWGLWNPTERLDTVTAAVVNLDEAVELDGQLVPLGRVLAGELIGESSTETESSGSSDSDAPTNFTWVLTDADDAAAGLDDGRYATVVTIPEDFSAAATSLAGDPADVKRANIQISESDRGRLIDTALSGIVTQTATQVVNQQLGEQFVDNIYVGFNTLGDGIGDAATGAGKLADGTQELAGGTRDLADGTTQLADGAAQLADGTSQLANGTSQLATGASALASGQSDLSDGVTAYTDGAVQLSESYGELAVGTTSVVQQLQGLSGALSGLEGPLANIGAGMQVAGGGALEFEGLITDCYASGASPAYCGELQQKLTPVGDGLTTVKTELESIQGMLQSLPEPDPNVDPQAELAKLQAGITAFGTGLAEYAAQGQQLASGAQQSAAGAAQLSAGVAELAGNVPQLSSGASQLASGTSELADGTATLADGTTELAGGAAELASGLDTAADGVPRTSDAERTKLAEAAVAPVEAQGGSDELFNSSGVPLFAGIAMWAGALAAFLVFAPLWQRTRDAARGVGFITLRSALPAMGLGALQGVIAGIVLPIALGYDLGKGAAFFGFALLAGIAFSLVVQGLSALLGGFGRFIAFVLLVVAFAVGIVSTVPGPLAAVGDASPVGTALSGFQSIATGAAGTGGAVTLLVLWALGGLCLTALAVARTRRSAN